MKNLKLQPIRSLSELFRSNGDRAFERNLRKQTKAGSYYTVTPLPHIYSNLPY